MALPPRTTLTELLRAIGVAFRIAGDATPIMVGKQYLADFGMGTGPRILFVPDPKGEAGAVLEIGSREVASRTIACAVYVRGAEDGTDEGRYEAAYQLSARVLNALAGLAPGRVMRGKAPQSADPVAVDAYGADDSWGFRYSFAVFVDQPVYQAAATAAPSLSPPDPDRLNGGSGLVFTQNVVTENTRP
jgi:hypothetical protein